MYGSSKKIVVRLRSPQAVRLRSPQMARHTLLPKTVYRCCRMSMRLSGNRAVLIWLVCGTSRCFRISKTRIRKILKTHFKFCQRVLPLQQKEQVSCTLLLCTVLMIMIWVNAMHCPNTTRWTRKAISFRMLRYGLISPRKNQTRPFVNGSKTMACCIKPKLLRIPIRFAGGAMNPCCIMRINHGLFA